MANATVTRIAADILWRFCCSLFICVAAARADVGALDGRVFAGSLRTEAQRNERYKLAFSDGRFCTTACSKDGHGAVSYSATRRAGSNVLQFEAKTSNKNGVTMTWQGTVDGARVHAEVETEERSGEKRHAMFYGVEKQGRVGRRASKGPRKKKPVKITKKHS